ncbi:MAG: monovalent cation/H(+) antiporter subunit G [Opitutaceae bacterium]|nr:monovalent cation/H(+) antiporter subunit G [Opitutaceae bacterium]
MIATLVHWLGVFMLGFGLVFLTVAAVGLARLPDVYCRCHALGKAFTLGINSLLLGLWCALDEPVVGLKIALVVFFLFVTIPVSTHLLTRLAWRARAPRWRDGGPGEGD